MNALSRRLLLPALAGLLALAAGAAAATPAPAKPAANPAERTKARITELLGRRLKPVPLPTAPANPFSITAAPAPDPGTPNTAAPAAPVDLLTRLARSLRIGGIINLGGKQSLVINSSPYREGALIPVRDGETVHRLRIKQITPTHLTLEMEGEETIVPLR